MILFPATPVIGIDPGQSGAVVRLWQWDPQLHEILECHRGFKKLSDIATAVQKTGSRTALFVIEQVGAMPGQGVCSMFSFGRATGAAFGAAMTFGTNNIFEVAPQKWQNWFRAELSIPKTDAFDSCVIATHLLKEHPEKLKALCHRRGPDHNACDAYLIAVWAANHLGTETLLSRRSEHCSHTSE